MRNIWRKHRAINRFLNKMYLILWVIKKKSLKYSSKAPWMVSLGIIILSSDACLVYYCFHGSYLIPCWFLFCLFFSNEVSKLPIFKTLSRYQPLYLNLAVAYWDKNPFWSSFSIILFHINLIVVKKTKQSSTNYANRRKIDGKSVRRLVEIVI